MSSSLTVDLDNEVLALAEQEARARHTTVAEVVRHQLCVMAKKLAGQPRRKTPITDKLRGAVKLPSNFDAQKTLIEELQKKHGHGDKIFLDTDVALDHLADRQPFSEYAHRLFALAEQDRITLCISALSFSNLYYILRKVKGSDGALDLLRQLKRIVKVTSVGEEEVHDSLAENFKDFEDALQYFSAKTEDAVKVVLTRNQFDFPKGLIRVESPEEYLKNKYDAG